jgi:hypothetical protein
MTGSGAAPIVDDVPIYSCDHCSPIAGWCLPYGYIDETWLTIGGGSFRYMSCYACRGASAMFAKDDPRWTRPAILAKK